MRLLLAALAFVTAAPVALRADDVVARQHRLEAQRRYEAAEELSRAELYEQAAREYGAAIRLDPQLVLAYYGLGQAFMALKLYPDAVATYVSCREVIRDRAALTQRERDSIDRERRDGIRELNELLRNLERALAQNRLRQPGLITQVEERIRVLESTALKGADQSLQVPAWLSLALGSAYLRQGLLPDAEREYARALSVDSKMGAAHNNLAFIYMRTGRFDEAEQALRQADKAGFVVSPRFREELQRRRAEAQAQPRN
jgi:tetratricopeptide (TPR) repeat protein